MKTDSCENYQFVMSELIDNGQPLSEALESHISACDECSTFASLCRPTGAHPLYDPLPETGAIFKQRILTLATEKPVSRWLRWVIPLTAAATLMIALGIRWSSDVETRSNRQAVENKTPITAPKISGNEIDALKQDLDRGLAQLVQPLVVFNSLAEH